MSRNTSQTESLKSEVTRLRRLLVGVTRNRPARDLISSNCESLELTHTQFHALLWLGFDGPLTMGELARRLGITEKTVTGLVDRLEREGHLQRERDAADRRVVHVRLTPKGAETFERIDAEIDQKITHFLGLLDQADRRDLFRIMQKLNDRLNPSAGTADK